jgi:hypothetical protein
MELLLLLLLLESSKSELVRGLDSYSGFVSSFPYAYVQKAGYGTSKEGYAQTQAVSSSTATCTDFPSLLL